MLYRQSSLRPLVEEFLAGGTLTSTELTALRDYLVRWIEGKAQAIARLAEEAPHLKERDDFKRWLAEAHFNDFGPLE